jgi:hypothetical protein
MRRQSNTTERRPQQPEELSGLLVVETPDGRVVPAFVKLPDGTWEPSPEAVSYAEAEEIA